MFITSCSGIRSNSVVPIQSKDKELTCKEIILEINEAEEYQVAAEKNKATDIRTFLAPFGYMFTVSSANEAIEASNKRIEYLKEIYRISGCSSGASRIQDTQIRGYQFGPPKNVPQNQQQLPPQTQQYQPQNYPPPTQQYQPLSYPAPTQYQYAPQQYAPQQPRPY